MAGFPGSNSERPVVLTQPRNDRRIGDAHSGIDLQCIETKVEQDRAAVLLAQSLFVRTKLRERRAPIHGALPNRQAKRHALAPAGAGGKLEADRAQVAGSARCGSRRAP